jgi:HEAT repeat protein
MRTFPSLLLVASFGLVHAPLAHADDTLRAQVVDLLSAYEEPATAAQLRALGADVGAELLAVAQDTTLSHTRRAGAVFALGYFPTDAHRGWLSALATTEGGDSLLRRKAVYALAAGWGDAALLDLGRALAAPDTQLRAATARALGRIGSPAAQDTLRARLAAEADPMVRSTLSSALGVTK